MAEEHRIETFPARDRHVVRWDPSDPESVDRARAEFERLRAGGYILFALEEKPGVSVERRAEEFPAGRSFVARPPVPVQTDTFNKEVVRIVAVRPAKGG